MSEAVTPLGNGRYLLQDGDSRRVAYAVVAGRQTWVFLDGHTFVVEPPRSSSGRTAASDAAASLASPMPATVTSVKVAVGDLVKAGDVLVVLEAMKMELPIRAPRDGRVKAIASREGELVQPGTPLVELE